MALSAPPATTTTRPIRRIDLYVAAILIAAAIALHALIPRYEWREVRPGLATQVDRWTGRATAYTLERTGTAKGYQWVAQ